MTPIGRPELSLTAAGGGIIHLHRLDGTLFLSGSAGMVALPPAEVTVLFDYLLENDRTKALDTELDEAIANGEETGRDEAEYRYQTYAAHAYEEAGDDIHLLRSYLTEIVTGTLTPYPAPEDPTP